MSERVSIFSLLRVVCHITVSVRLSSLHNPTEVSLIILKRIDPSPLSVLGVVRHHIKVLGCPNALRTSIAHADTRGREVIRRCP